MAGPLIRRAMSSPQLRMLAAAAWLARSPRTRRAAWRVLTGRGPVGRAARVRAGATGGRAAARSTLMMLGAAGLAALAVRELPSLRREIKIWRM
jgi:hypothetical protein